MQTRIETSNAVVLGQTRSKSLTLKADHKTFRAFSDGLYSDKIGSIIREVCSNAVDAHRMGNNMDTPFSVILPCRANPKFVVRDYGIGLSVEDVDNVFSVYGESTKDKDNDNIGGFGLGSKTPFAYTDQFFVRSYYNGEMFTFCFYFSSDEPQYDLIHHTKTDEPNGLEVYFNVRPEDFKEFKTKVTRILPWMQVIPDVWMTSTEENGFFSVDFSDYNNLRSTMITDRQDSIIYEDDDVIIGTFSHLDKISIEQGGVVYNSNKQNVEMPELEKLISALSHDKKLILKCPIGTVELARSRESISWSREVTIPNVKAMCEKILNKSEQVFSDMVNHCSSDFQVKSLAFKFHSINTYQILNKDNVFLNINNKDFPAYYAYMGYLSAVKNATNPLHHKIIVNKSKPASNFEVTIDDDFIPDAKTKVFSFGRNVDKNEYTSIRKDKNEDHITTYPYQLRSERPIRVIFRDGKKVNMKYAVNQIADIPKDSSRGELVFLIDVPKSELAEKQSKTDWFKQNAKPIILEQLGAIESDIIFSYESDYNLRPVIGAKKQAVRHDIAVFSVDANKFIKSINNLAHFNCKNVVYVMKDGHGVSINGHYMKRQAFVSSFGFYIYMLPENIDTVVIVNKKEKEALETVCNKVVSLDDAVKKMVTNKVLYHELTFILKRSVVKKIYADNIDKNIYNGGFHHIFKYFNKHYPNELTDIDELNKISLKTVKSMKYSISSSKRTQQAERIMHLERNAFSNVYSMFEKFAIFYSDKKWMKSFVIDVEKYRDSIIELISQFLPDYSYKIDNKIYDVGKDIETIKMASPYIEFVNFNTFNHNSDKLEQFCEILYKDIQAQKKINNQPTMKVVNG